LNCYEYISANCPDAANEICKKYGYYEVENLDELAYCLNQIVGNHGEPALKEIMELHPDKDTLLEIFQKKTEPIIIQQVATPPITPTTTPTPATQANFLNADGSVVGNTNTYILIGAALIGFAIIMSSKS